MDHLGPSLKEYTFANPNDAVRYPNALMIVPTGSIQELLIKQKQYQLTRGNAYDKHVVLFKNEKLLYSLSNQALTSLIKNRKLYGRTMFKMFQFE